MSTRPRKPVRDDFDGAWKNMLSEKRFSDFVAFFMPEVHAEIDWSRSPVFLEQELRAITRKTRRGQRAVDRLVKVWLLDGAERWVLIHVEIQSQSEPGFSFRMFQYYFRGRDLFPDRSIACLAVLGDEDNYWKPDLYTDTLWQTRVEFRYRIVKLKEYTNRLQELEKSANPFARFVLAHLKTLETQSDYETRMQWKLRIIQGLYDMGVPEEEIGQLYHDFDWLLALPETLSTRYHREMTRFEENRTMPHLSTAERIGRKIGRQEGQIEEAQASILEILEARMSVIPPDVALRVAQINDLNSLRMLRRRLLEGASLSELGLTKITDVAEEN